MSSELNYRARKALVSDNGTSKVVGGALVGTSVGAGVLWVAAGLLPFINFPALLVIAVVAGLVLYLK